MVHQQQKFFLVHSKKAKKEGKWCTSSKNHFWCTTREHEMVHR